MPGPSSALTTLRPDLGGSFMEYDVLAREMGYIATQVFPVFEAAKPSGTFGTIPVEQLLQTRDTTRSPGSGYARGEWEFSTDTFACIEHGAEEAIDDNQATAYREWFDAEQVAAARAMSSVQRNAEIRVHDAVFNTSTWTGSSLTTAIGGGLEWDVAASAKPIADVEAAAQLVYDNSGFWPNALVITKKVFRNLRVVAEIQDVISSSGAGMPENAGMITQQMLSTVFDLPFIIVGGSTKNTAAEGATASLASVWDDEYAMVCRVSTTNDISEPCIGRTIHWSEDGSDIGGTVETYRDETVRGDIVRVRHQVDEKMLYAQAGHLLSNVTT